MHRLACFAFIVIRTVAAAEPPIFFLHAKRLLADKIYSDHPVPFCCGCSYGEAFAPGKPNRARLTADAASCALESIDRAVLSGSI